MYRFIALLFLFFSSQMSFAQKNVQDIPLISLQMPDTLHKPRIWTASLAGATIYSAASITLWNSWYKNYELSSFHLFDDRGEWEGMDKAGHFFTTYNEARWIYNGARWTGINQRKSAWIGVAVASGLQMTIEVMDGFSDKWGFSLADVGFNTLGAGLFIGQEYLWEEQRITMKISSRRQEYPSTLISSIDGGETTTLQQRADDLYGSTFAQRFLKDYNSQTIWLSFNIHSFLPNKNSKFPKWLNIAAGFGAENMYAGYGYEFTNEEGATFRVNPDLYPRYNQAFLALDVDLTRIPTNSRVLKTIFGILNFIKIPSPALEFSRQNGFKLRGIQ